MLIDYINYRVWRFAKTIAMGLSAVPRAAGVLTFILLFWTSIALDLIFELGIKKGTMIPYLIYFGVVHYLSYRLFSDPERQHRTEQRLKSESWLTSVAWNIIVAILCFVTLFTLVGGKMNIV
ncbi:hypothetical protein [Nafulsella turpanensis]|uniref:hypothetical protein n=1 Tax=Nafulsella turpanensis TaxID=1265690 RepID=UPI0003463EDB|nr:hypothetical protein [Nafulsella turpanensis]